MKELDVSNFYIQNKTNKKGDIYTYYPPYCKQCYIEKSDKWQKDNKERHAECVKIRYHNNKEYREYKINMAKYQVITGYREKWEKLNRDKLIGYSKKRQSTKMHTITQQEWDDCLNFFNDSCAYCGMTLKEHVDMYNQILHKEHVDSNGNNGIENCIPACRRCNSSKNTRDMHEWYIEKDYYSNEREKAINNWVNMHINQTD